MKTKVISVTEYAAIRGITRQAILKRIGQAELPGVTKYEKVGSTYVLTVEEKWIKENASKK